MENGVKSINRILARELTAEEVGEVGGGDCSRMLQVTSAVGTREGNIVIADPIMDFSCYDQYA